MINVQNIIDYLYESAQHYESPVDTFNLAETIFYELVGYDPSHEEIDHIMRSIKY